MLFSLLDLDLTINTIVGIVGIVVGLPSFITVIIFTFKTLNKKQFYKVFFRTLYIKKNSMEMRHFKGYVKHTFTYENSIPPKENISYNEFIKSIKDTKIVILTASAGMGKSILMQRLAAKFRLKIQKDKSGENLEHYGVLFYKLGRQNNLTKTIQDIEEKIKDSSISYSIYLDGLDEISELSVTSGSEVLNDLLEKLIKDIAPKCSRIFISLRPEILDKGYSVARYVRGKDDISFFKIQHFNEKQILAMYRNEKHNDTQKIKPKIHRQNLKKLKSVIKDNYENHKGQESIFATPVILTWANDILSECGIEKLKSISWYEALGTVIDKEIEREYDLYRDSEGAVILEADFSADQFKKDCKEFLLNMSLDMALSKKLQVTYDSASDNAFAKRLKRRLLRYVEWSEEENTKPCYEFRHNTIYWRALAEVLLSPDTPQDIRVQIILSQKADRQSTQLLQYCRQGLWSIQKGKRNIFPYSDYFTYMDAVESGDVKCNTQNIPIPLEIILSCFYGFPVITFDYSVRLDNNRIKEFVENRKLNLSFLNVKELTFLEKFGKDNFDVLDCSNTNVMTVTIPDYVKEINFKQCTLLGSITIPDSVTTIGKEAFYVCGRLKSITIPGSVTTIGKAAFSYCTSLETVVLSDGIESIGELSFAECTSLTNITIPGSVTTIGKAAFSYCTSLETVVLSDGVERIEKSAFQECISLKTITIPGSVTTIEKAAFFKCTSLETVVLSDGVESIGEFSFAECTSLTNITIPDSVESIEASAFQECISLKTITIPGSVTTIGKAAFAYCSPLETVVLSDGIESIGEFSFAECTSLTNITIPGSVESIEKGAFQGCTSLKTITIPGSVENIGKAAFAYCSSLETVVLSDGVESIGDLSFAKCTSLTNITIPGSVESIEAEAFQGCTSLKTITIPGSVKTIREGAFFECTSLETVVLSDGIESIGEFSFAKCTSLTKITIPDSVESIEKGAFQECESLEQIRYNGTVSQWEKVEKVEKVGPFLGSKVSKIICTDGIVEIS